MMVLALLPACSTSYLVDGRDLDRARQRARAETSIPVPAQNEESGERVLVDVERLSRDTTPVGDRLRVRARPHPAIPTGIGLFAGGAVISILNGIAWAFLNHSCQRQQFSCDDIDGAVVRTTTGVFAVAAVAGAITWVIGEITRPVEVARGR